MNLPDHSFRQSFFELAEKQTVFWRPLKRAQTLLYVSRVPLATLAHRD